MYLLVYQGLEAHWVFKLAAISLVVVKLAAISLVFICTKKN